jgi:nucleoside-diphosphate-sugar epimerase
MTGKRYLPIIQTDYTSEDSLLEQLRAKHATVVICAFPMDSNSTCDAQLRLIRAADRCLSVRRFIPSEFNVEYDVGDDVLPYPEKRFHLTARQELAQTSNLEYAYIYPGMFMDYFGLPRVTSSLRPLCFCIDPASGQAVLPGDGEGRMSMTLTTDAARYLVLALELDKWPRIMTTVASTISMNELVVVYEKSLGRKLQVQYQPVEKLLKHETIELPVNVAIAKDYPDRFPQGVRGIVADLEAAIALGGYDLSSLGEHLNLVKAFEGKAPAPRRIEDLIEEAWKPVSRQLAGI